MVPFSFGPDSVLLRLDCVLITLLLLNLSDAYEQTIDPLYSVTVPPGDGPLVAFNQVHNTLLGLPYSVCIPQLNHTLKYYSNYTIGR